MRKFIFEGKRTYEETFTITVEANSFEEAQELINEGEYEENDDHQQNFVGGSDDIIFLKEEKPDNDEDYDIGGSE